MKETGTEAIRTKIQPSKTKLEITKTTNSQNTKRIYVQPCEQLFPKRWPLSNSNQTENIITTNKMKRHQNSDSKTGNREPQQNYRLGTVSNELLGGLNTSYGANLALSFGSGKKTFSWLFGSHDNHLTRH